jgi:hypothetical protein
VLGIALTGLIPLVVMQSRQQARLESRLDAATTHYLVPSSDNWAAKLGAPAIMQSTEPGTKTTAVLVMDNLDSGYSESGDDWHDDTGGYQDGSRAHAAGSGDASATWTFTGLKPGWYQVEVTWNAADGRSNAASYVITDLTSPSNVRATVAIDQTQSPSGDTYDGQSWQSLAVVPVRGTSLSVTLAESAAGTISADAVRLVAVRNTIQVTSLTRSLSDETVSASVTVTVETPE